MRRRARGLTLLEVVVALAIVAVLATLALPSFGSIVARHRLKAAAEQMAADLGELRLLAAQRGQTLHLNVQPGAQWCYALATLSGCDCRVAQSCQMKTVRAADHPGVTLVEGSEVTVNPQPVGPVLYGSQALLRGSEGATLRVGLTPLGRPKVCAPGAAVVGTTPC